MNEPATLDTTTLTMWWNKLLAIVDEAQATLLRWWWIPSPVAWMRWQRSSFASQASQARQARQARQASPARYPHLALDICRAPRYGVRHGNPKPRQAYAEYARGA